MKLPKQFISATVFALTLVLSADPSTLAMSDRPEEPAPSQVDAIFGDIGDADPGCAIGVTQGDKSLLRRQYGLASLEHRLPIAADTVFDAASVSKQFTAFAILLLAEEGKLSLNDDVRRYLPQLPDYGGQITIRHLLQHTSGLRDYGDLLSLAGQRAADPLSEEEAFSLIFRQRALNFAPGTQRQYNNSGYLLLGRIVERVSGKTLRVFAAERIFRPLGMAATFFQNRHDAVAIGRAWGYSGSSGRWLFSLPVNDTYGPSNLFTTVGDLLKWEQNFSQKRVGSRASLAAMETRGRLTSGAAFDYGLGLEVVDIGGLVRIGHSGGNEGFNSMTARFPARGLSVVVLCNQTAGNAPGRAQRVADLFLGRVPARATLTDQQPEISLPAAALARFGGTYRNPITNEIRQLEVRNGRLVYLRGPGSVLIPMTPTRFRFPTGGNVVELLARPGRPLEMRVIPESQAPVVYEALPPFDNTRTPLHEYVGEYYGEEIETTYTVTQRPKGISIRGRLEEPTELSPIYPDAFSSGDLLVRFTRNRAGRIAGMLVDQVRVRNLRFVKRSSRGLYRP